MNRAECLPFVVWRRKLHFQSNSISNLAMQPQVRRRRRRRTQEAKWSDELESRSGQIRFILCASTSTRRHTLANLPSRRQSHLGRAYRRALAFQPRGTIAIYRQQLGSLGLHSRREARSRAYRCCCEMASGKEVTTRKLPLRLPLARSPRSSLFVGGQTKWQSAAVIWRDVGCNSATRAP